MKVLENHINVFVFNHYSLLEVREIFEHEFEGKTYTQDNVLYEEKYPRHRGLAGRYERRCIFSAQI